MTSLDIAIELHGPYASIPVLLFPVQDTYQYLTLLSYTLSSIATTIQYDCPSIINHHARHVAHPLQSGVRPDKATLSITYVFLLIRYGV